MPNKSEIMQAAWKEYRDETRFSRPAKLEGRRRLFARCLAYVWARAKAMARRAAMTATERAAEQIARIKQAIDQLQYLPFGMRVEPRRRELAAELSHWQAIAAAA